MGPSVLMADALTTANVISNKRYAQIGALELESHRERERVREKGTDLLLEVPLAFSQGA